MKGGNLSRKESDQNSFVNIDQQTSIDNDVSLNEDRPKKLKLSLLSKKTAPFLVIQTVVLPKLRLTQFRRVWLVLSVSGRLRRVCQFIK